MIVNELWAFLRILWQDYGDKYNVYKDCFKMFYVYVKTSSISPNLGERIILNCYRDILKDRSYYLFYINWKVDFFYALEGWFHSLIGGFIPFFHWRVNSYHSLNGSFLLFIGRLIPFIHKRVDSFHSLEGWFLSFIKGLIPFIH